MELNFYRKGKLSKLGFPRVHRAVHLLLWLGPDSVGTASPLSYEKQKSYTRPEQADIQSRRGIFPRNRFATGAGAGKFCNQKLGEHFSETDSPFAILFARIHVRRCDYIGIKINFVLNTDGMIIAVLLLVVLQCFPVRKDRDVESLFYMARCQLSCCRICISLVTILFRVERPWEEVWIVYYRFFFLEIALSKMWQMFRP